MTRVRLRPHPTGHGTVPYTPSRVSGHLTTHLVSHLGGGSWGSGPTHRAGKEHPKVSCVAVGDSG